MLYLLVVVEIHVIITPLVLNVSNLGVLGVMVLAEMMAPILVVTVPQLPIV